jgi:eukaryotic-like serine/threonine-protein kinase
MADELEPGAYVTPSVRLVRVVAEGGMGKVWVAEHLVLHTNVCVKMMSKEVVGRAGAAARFAREAAVAAAVKSPHVVQVFDSGVTESGVAFIVMELLEGHDLAVEITKRGHLPPGEVVTIITQLAKALAKAHRVGVVHRDIKPENVFLCDVEGGETFVKLLDFGTAKTDARSPATSTASQVIGTPYYMSPEQMVGGAVDARSDVWALGVVTYEALTGTRPYEGLTLGAITLAVHKTQPRIRPRRTYGSHVHARRTRTIGSRR